MEHDPVGTTGNFGNLAADYESGRREYPQTLLECVLTHIRNPSESLLLDVGCGTGKATRLLAPRVRMVIGVDPDAKCIQTALEQGGSSLAYRKASAENLPFDAAAFDAVTTFSSFHWWCDLPGVLTEIHRVLRADGVFLIINKQDAGPFRRKARAVIAQYSPVELTDRKKDYDPEHLLKADGRWNVNSLQVHHEEQFTLPELIRQIRSLSVWNCIPEARRTEASDALQAHFSLRLEQGIYHRPLVMHIVVAHKSS